MSETVCIHGIPVDPWYIHCDQCDRDAEALGDQTGELEPVRDWGDRLIPNRRGNPS